jgi:hypothetical protein
MPGKAPIFHMSFAIFHFPSDSPYDGPTTMTNVKWKMTNGKCRLQFQKGQLSALLTAS